MAKDDSLSICSGGRICKSQWPGKGLYACQSLRKGCLETYLNSASKRSTTVLGDEFMEMKTSAKRTVGLLRRRGVACSRSNSLMGGDESIRGTRMSQCGLLLGCVCVPIPHKAFPGNRCQDKCMSASNPQIRLGKPALLDPVQIEISPLACGCAGDHRGTHHRIQFRCSPYQHFGLDKLRPVICAAASHLQGGNGDETLFVLITHRLSLGRLPHGLMWLLSDA